MQLNMLFLYSSLLAVSGTLKKTTHKSKTKRLFGLIPKYKENKDVNNSNMQIIPVNIYYYYF